LAHTFKRFMWADNVDGVWGHECEWRSISFVINDAVVLSVWVCDWCSMYGDWLEWCNDSFSQVLASRTVVCRKQKEPATWSGSLWAHQKHRVQCWWVVNHSEWTVHRHVYAGRCLHSDINLKLLYVYDTRIQLPSDQFSEVSGSKQSISGVSSTPKVRACITLWPT